MLGTTVFHGTQNFEPSCGICSFEVVSAEFLFLRNLALASDKGTSTAYFGQVQATIENYCMHT